MLHAGLGDKSIYYYTTNCPIDTSNSNRIYIRTHGRIVYRGRHKIDREYSYLDNGDGKMSEFVKPIALISFHNKVFVVEERTYYEGLKYAVKIME